MAKRGKHATGSSQSTSQSELRPAHSLLESLLMTPGAPLSPAYQRFRLEQVWPELVGGSIAQNARPLSFLKGVLTLSVSHPAWVHQLGFLRQDLMDRINSRMGPDWVVEIKFQVRPVERSREETETGFDPEGSFLRSRQSKREG